MSAAVGNTGVLDVDKCFIGLLHNNEFYQLTYFKQQLHYLIILLCSFAVS